MSEKLTVRRTGGMRSAVSNVLWKISLDEMLTWLRTLRGLFLIVLQLGFILIVAHQFAIEENYGFSEIIPLIFVGFVVHALLPLRFRPPFFLALSLAAIVTILGLKQGTALIIVGLGMISLCHLPVAFAIRVGLLIFVGAGLAVVRGGWIETSWESLPIIILPILGAMFMFRLMIYLYDLRHEKEPVSIWQRLSYFFMLPNVCFLLFPVVDYQTFRRTYYDGAPEGIYQKGLLWITRGIVHLLLYRVVYHHLLPSATEVVDLAGVVLFMLTTYALYLRISGLFHLVIGIMCLFGFNLPETHRLYYLASSFTDYWRRINIYWKDFMLKLFYYPSLMKFRRWGMTTALVLSTLLVFGGTWLLHSYQWFWLQGEFPLTGPDALFWGILGGLVVINSLIEAKQSRKRSLKKQAWSFRAAFLHSLKVMGMFVFICTLWSLWSSETIGDWLVLMEVAATGSAQSWAILLAGMCVLVSVGVLFQYVGNRGWSLTLVGSRPSLKRSAIYVTSVSGLLLVLSAPQIQIGFGESSSEFLASIRTDHLNEHDLADVERGYYEGLLDAGGFVASMQKMKGLPEIEPFDEAAGVRGTGDLLVKELIPQTEFAYAGATVRTNRWGMRDMNYSGVKPPSTYRVALLGASHVMGNGVENDEMFEALVEERINRLHLSGTYESYELMNFSVTGYGPLQVAHVAMERLAPFEPDAVFYFAHSDQVRRLIDKFGWSIYRGQKISNPYLQDVIEQANVKPGMSTHKISRRLGPFGEDMLKWAYRSVVKSSESIGALPVWVFIPWVDQETDAQDIDYLAQLARDAGFMTMSLEGAYQEYGNRDSLQVASWDTHPNADGHTLLAEKLFNELVARNQELGLDLNLSEPVPASVASN